MMYEPHLIPGNIYMGGIRKPFPRLGTQSGFRKKLCEDSKGRTKKGEWAYIVLQATGDVSEWPDRFDERTGVFTYYGDQKDLSKDIFDTKQKGNTLLHDVFDWLHNGQYEKIPPFFVFEDDPSSNGARFIGLAVPGNKGIPFGHDLVYATDKDGKAVNNYLAHFTILDVSDSPITYEWLQARIWDKEGSNELAPKAWQDFMISGTTEWSSDEDIINAIDETASIPNIDGEERKSLTNHRVNQSIFRDRLFIRYHKCCLCDVHNPSLLRASHIKPWSASEPSEKLDTDNGLLLCPNHDVLFDAGFISFTDDGHILVSQELDNDDRVNMNIRDDMKIKVTEGNKKYLHYHRESIFRK